MIKVRFLKEAYDHIGNFNDNMEDVYNMLYTSASMLGKIANSGAVKWIVSLADLPEDQIASEEPSINRSSYEDFRVIQSSLLEAAEKLKSGAESFEKFHTEYHKPIVFAAQEKDPRAVVANKKEILEHIQLFRALTGSRGVNIGNYALSDLVMADRALREFDFIQEEVEYVLENDISPEGPERRQKWTDLIGKINDAVEEPRKVIQDYDKHMPVLNQGFTLLVQEAEKNINSMLEDAEEEGMPIEDDLDEISEALSGLYSMIKFDNKKRSQRKSRHEEQ